MIAGVIGAVGVVLVVVAVVVAMVLHDHHHKATHAGSTGTRTGVTSTARGDQSATDCTPNVSTGGLPVNGVVSAGGLSFAQSVAPDWVPRGDSRMPNALDAVSLVQTVVSTSSSSWIAQVTVGVTNFNQSMSIAAQAELMLKCVVKSNYFAPYSPDVPAVTSDSVKSGRVDGVPTSEIDVPVEVAYPNPQITGDDVVVIIVGTKPSTVFFGTSPIGDTARRDVVRAAVAALHVASD